LCCVLKYCSMRISVRDNNAGSRTSTVIKVGEAQLIAAEEY